MWLHLIALRGVFYDEEVVPSCQLIQIVSQEDDMTDYVNIAYMHALNFLCIVKVDKEPNFRERKNC